MYEIFKPPKPAAFLDLDGSLFRGRMIPRVSDMMTEKGYFHPSTKKNITMAHDQFHGVEDGLNKFCYAYGEEYRLALKGISVSDFNSELDKFVENYYPKNIFPQSKSLVEKLQTNDYVVFVVSLVPFDLARKIGDKLGADGSFGITFEKKKGVYTGKSLNNMYYEDGKGKIVQTILDSNLYNLNRTITVIDSVNDVSMGDKIKNPKNVFVINSKESRDDYEKDHEEMIMLSKENGWNIVHHSEMLEVISKNLELVDFNTKNI